MPKLPQVLQQTYIQITRGEEARHSYNQTVLRVKLYPVSSSTVSIAPHCPPFEATGEPEKVYWGAELTNGSFLPVRFTRNEIQYQSLSKSGLDFNPKSS